MRDVVHVSRVSLLMLGAAILAACSTDSVPPTALLPVARDADLTVNTPEFTVSATSQDDDGFGVASDGVNAIVGFRVGVPDVTNTVRAKTFGIGGHLIGSLNTGRTGDTPLVAYGSSKYLMIWADHSDTNEYVYGQFVTTAGAASGAPFPISSERHVKGAYGIAYGSGKFLVMYRTAANAMKARFVWPTRTLGGTVTIASPAGDLGLENLASDGTNWVAVYTNSTNTAVRTRLIHANGTMGTSLLVNGVALDGNDPVGIGYSSGKYLVTWNTLTSASQENPRGRLLTAANALGSGVIAIDNTVAHETVAGPIKYGDGFMVGYVRWNNGAAYGRIVSGAGVVGAPQQYFGVSAGKMGVPFGVAIGSKIFFAVDRATLSPGGTRFESLHGFDLKAAVKSP